MADYNNDLLQYLKNDPFEDYEEVYESDLFRFSANEIDLKVEMDKFDTMAYGETIKLSKNGITIEGYIKGKTRYPLEHYGIIRLQSSMIKAADNITFSTGVNEFFSAMGLVTEINAENGVFSSVTGSFQTSRLNGTLLGSNSFTHSNRSYDYHRISVWRAQNDQNYLKVVFKSHEWYMNIDITTTIYWDVNSNTLSIYDNREPQWVYFASQTNNFKSQYIDYLFYSLLSSITGEDKNYTAIDVVDYNGRLLMLGFDGPDTLDAFIIYNNNIEIPYLSLQAESQPFYNILSDLCFIYNSYFYVKNFDQLIIKGLNEGINTIDIGAYKDFFGERFQQSVKPYKYQDYQFKTVNEAGENGFGFTEELQNKLNSDYRSYIVGTLETTFNILRVRNEPDITDLPDIAINDQIIDGNYNFGLVKKIGYELEGKVYVLKCVRYLSDMEFNDFWEF